MPGCPRRSSLSHPIVRLVRRCPGIVAPLALSLACAGGCTSMVTPGETIVSHSQYNPSDPQESPRDGEYKLYSTYGDPMPKHTATLRKGDPLGFRGNGNGTVTAVAGDDEWTYTDVNLIWKRTD